MHRRTFLQATAGVGALAAIQSRAYSAAVDPPIRVAVVGTGWYGQTDLCHLMQVAPVEVVGLCDVDGRQLAGAAELAARRQPSGKRPPLYGDYRKLLADQRSDVVLVATPDHWHALPTIAACEAGADVYCQKPLSIDVLEGQAMVAAARLHGRTVQVGLQRRSTPHLLEARNKYLTGGKLGRVAQVEIHSYYGVRADFPPPAAPPADLDWEMYVGPAPWVDYNPEIHPRAWRDRREFSNGQIGDLCVHYFDLVRSLLDLGWPTRISAAGGAYQRPARSRVNVPDTQTALFDYPDLQIVWTQRSWGVDADRDFPWATTLYGEHGLLKLSVQRYEFVPHDGGPPERGEHVDEREKYPQDLEHTDTELFAAPATRRHMEDFLAARREGRRPVSDIEQGHVSSASCILANLSMDLGRDLHWDAAAGRVAGDDEANARLARAYRAPWRHPAPSGG